ncbi:hypothetical protein [Mycoplasma phocoeninasale]|uniref:hypothetical protein n=1 Tax=Mycoplasma phocoeninasale TaxID=2726117 RepID=UPI001967A484|nr:hypothetical protein [Mycoplasma phocoeninasale]MBN0970877.1 hypothetical protein [Mycoplasma phocoeninasale]
MKKIKWIIALSLPIVATPLVAAACGSKDMMKDKTPPPKDTPKDPMQTPPNDGMQQTPPPANEMPKNPMMTPPNDSTPQTPPPAKDMPKDPMMTPPNDGMQQTPPPAKDMPPKKEMPQTPPNDSTPQTPPAEDMSNNPNMMMPETPKPIPPVMPKVETAEEKEIKIGYLNLYYLSYLGLINKDEFKYDFKNDYQGDIFTYLNAHDKKNSTVLENGLELLRSIKSNDPSVNEQLKSQQNSQPNTYKVFWDFLNNIYKEFISEFKNDDENTTLRIFVKYWDTLKSINKLNAGYLFQILYQLSKYSSDDSNSIKMIAKKIFDSVDAFFTKGGNITIMNIDSEVTKIKNYLENLDNTPKK